MAIEIAGAVFVLWLWGIQKKPEWFCPFCRSEIKKSRVEDGKSNI